MAENNPLVTVSMITYNHEKFIGKAIESILVQKTNFNFEYLIGDDCSTDNTPSICARYKEENPSIIKLRLGEKNIGFQSNFIENIYNAKGKYIAYLEGDDYWIDKNKLQKQFDFMEAHPEVAFCYTNTYLFNDGNEEEVEVVIKKKPTQKVFDFDYYVKEDFPLIPTLTLFIRKDAFPDPVPEWLNSTFNFDWALNILLFQKGKAAYIDEITAMYRIHEGGVITSTYFPKVAFNGIKLAKNIDKYLNYKYHNVFGKSQWRYHNIVIYYFEKKMFLKGFYWLLFCFFRNPIIFTTNTFFFKTLYNVIFKGHKT